MHLRFVIVVILALGLAGQAQTPASKVPVLNPGVHLQTFRVPGEPFTIRYAISIPQGYSPSTAVPLVLALHYGGSPNGAAQGVLLTLVQPAFAELGAIVVAPESLRGAWNTAENDHAVNALLEAVQGSYRIDTRRIAVTGFSMGGSGVWYFAGKYPERFSAAIPVAGMPPPSAEKWRTPVFAVHSRDDEVMPIGPTETRIRELQKGGIRAELVVLTGISHYQTNRFVEGLRRAVPWLQQLWK